MLSNKMYDRLKFVLQFALPALAALVFGITNLWGLPYGDKILGTISVVELALGTLLGISTKSYKAQLGEAEKNEPEK